jgi:hypothetical protein
VTLYGLIDESLNYVSNEGGHRAFTQTSGNVQGSRQGIKGTEDLGSGYQAIFTFALRRAGQVGRDDCPRPDVDRCGGRQLSVRARAAASREFAHRHEERRFDRHAKYVGGRCNLLPDARGISAGRLRVLEAE